MKGLTYFLAPGMTNINLDRPETIAQANNVKFKNIRQIVCKELEVDWSLIIHDTRKREIVEVRHYIYYLARTHTTLSFKAIGDMMNRHHSSVLVGIKAFRDWMQYDKRIIETLKRLEAKII